MTTHKTGTREQWLTERLELLKAEKELTAAATNWRDSGSNCPGSGSRSSTGST